MDETSSTFNQGEVQIGLDYFALPNDEIIRAYNQKKLQRNFQGYTTDTSPTLLGFGSSAIGHVSSGYVQNKSKIKGYQLAIDKGHLPIAKGIAVKTEDKLRREVIKNIMCYLEVDLESICLSYGKSPEYFSKEIKSLKEMQKDALLKVRGYQISIPDRNRVFLRVIYSLFDAYFRINKNKHSLLV